MKDFKQSIIILIISAAVFLGCIYGLYYWHNQAVEKLSVSAFNAGQKSIKPVSTKIDTVRDTIRIRDKKKPEVAKEDSSTIKFIDALIAHRDSLELFVRDRMRERTFTIEDTNSGSSATIVYCPIKDEYTGNLVISHLDVTVENVKEPLPCPPVVEVEAEAWYSNPSIFISGGAVGVIVVASGGTALMGIGVTVAVGSAIAIF